MRQYRASEKVTRPEDCVLGFGIPTTREEFELSRRLGAPGSFAQQVDIPAKYQFQVIDPIQRFGAHMRRLGAVVVPDLTLARYSELFHNPKTQAVILISHWGEDFIEFHDGLASIDSIIQAIPQSFTGVIDLCVCHPKELIPPLRSNHMQASIYFLAVKATLPFWLYFYRDLFRLLRRGTMDYLEASASLSSAYLNAPKEPSQ